MAWLAARSQVLDALWWRTKLDTETETETLLTLVLCDGWSINEVEGITWGDLDLRVAQPALDRRSTLAPPLRGTPRRRSKLPCAVRGAAHLRWRTRCALHRELRAHIRCQVDAKNSSSSESVEFETRRSSAPSATRRLECRRRLHARPTFVSSRAASALASTLS
jgi:hypothetical protein